VANDVMKRFEERAAKAHAESVARGEHDDQCEYQAIKGWYLCNCSMRARLARGLTEVPELEFQYPVCLGCNESVHSDGDSYYCPNCSVSWNSRGSNGHFNDDHGDLHTEIAETREQQTVDAGGPIPVPNGCRWCGIEKPNHVQRHAQFVGIHGWVEPTNRQRLTRMKARRAARTTPSTGNPYASLDENAAMPQRVVDVHLPEPAEVPA
jgi:hypothetical protein